MECCETIIDCILTYSMSNYYHAFKHDISPKTGVGNMAQVKSRQRWRDSGCCSRQSL